jgi:hypothetical protein
MRRGFGLIGLVVATVLFVIVGVIAYNIGWSDGVNTHLPAAASDGTVAPYYYGYGFHPFFAGFGILWFFLILFGIFWLFRLVFWGFLGRRMWMGGRGYGRGWGYGPGRQSFEERAAEWHRQQHAEPPPPPSAPPTPPADAGSV